MTQEEANSAATSSNTALGAGVATIKYGVFARWSNNHVKDYSICLYNTQYDTEFGAATESQLLAFARVSIQTIGIMLAGDDAAAREAIEAEAAEKTKAIKREQAKADKEQALFNVH